MSDLGRYLKKMTPCTNCKKCGVEILQATATRCRGKCAVCWQRRPIAQTAKFGETALAIISIPFLIVYASIRGVVDFGLERIRIWKFPYDRANLRIMISDVHPNTKVATNYFRGVLEGLSLIHI